MIFFLLGCNPLPESVTMTGTVWNAPYTLGAPVPGALVEVLDAGGNLVGSVTAAADGSFSADVPAGVQFFVTVSADGHVPTAFSGTSGISDFAAPEGYPWTAPDAWTAALREEFASCPTVGEPGGIVAGEVVGNVAEYPPIATASVLAYGPDEVEVHACYLDDEGASSPDATVTGDTGRFAIFGVPAGEIVLDVRYSDGAGQEPVELYRFFAPEAGLVPVYPAILDIL